MRKKEHSSGKQLRKAPPACSAGGALSGCEQNCKPGSVFDSHLSSRVVADAIKPPRERSGQPVCSHTGVAPNRVYSDGYFYAPSGELLPRLSTLTSSPQTSYPSLRRKWHSSLIPLLLLFRKEPFRWVLSGDTGETEEYEVCDDEAVYLCCTFPEVAFGGRYPLFLPCGARTFLTTGPFAPVARLSVFLAPLLYRSSGEMSMKAASVPWKERC